MTCINVNKNKIPKKECIVLFSMGEDMIYKCFIYDFIEKLNQTLRLFIRWLSDVISHHNDIDD